VKEAATISAFTPTHGYEPTREAAMAARAGELTEMICRDAGTAIGRTD
jgi:hypothetical protein